MAKSFKGRSILSFVLVMLVAVALGLTSAAAATANRPEKAKATLKAGKTQRFRMDAVDTALAFRNTSASITRRGGGHARETKQLSDRSRKKYLASYRLGDLRIIARASPVSDVLRGRFINRGERPARFRFTYIHRTPTNGDASPGGDGTPNAGGTPTAE